MSVTLWSSNIEEARWAGLQWVPSVAGLPGGQGVQAELADRCSRQGLSDSADCALVAAAYVKQENTEPILATYESSRRRQRIDLPLRIEDSPASMLQDGTLTTGG